MITASSFDLQDQVSVVTGAARGMGLAIAEGLAGSGAKVVIADVDEAAAEAAAADLRAAGHEALAVAVDHTDQPAVDALMRRTESEFGPVDILVNNAGILSMYDFLDMSLEQWDHIMSVNLRGPLLCMMAAVPGMVERRRGSVINIGSSYSSRTAVMNFSAGGTDYCVSKSGLQALTRSVAQNVAPYGVRVNAIGPGVVDTPMHAAHREHIVGMLPYIPVGRLQESDDVVGTVLYLASEASSYVTGQTVHVNGGMLMVD